MLRLRGGQRGFLQPAGHLVGVLPKVLQQHLIGPQIPLHPRNVSNPPQVSPKHQAVESGKHPVDLISKLRDKLFHAVLVSMGFLSSNNEHPTVARERLSHFGCGYAALCILSLTSPKRRSRKEGRVRL